MRDTAITDEHRTITGLALATPIDMRPATWAHGLNALNDDESGRFVSWEDEYTRLDTEVEAMHEARAKAHDERIRRINRNARRRAARAAAKEA